MNGKGDITDAFDDDALRRAVEAASDTGRWRNNTAEFQDPKIKALLQELAKPEPVEPPTRPQRKATPAPATPLAPPAAPRPPAPPPASFQAAPELDVDAFERDLAGELGKPVAAARLPSRAEADLDAFERDLAATPAPPATGEFQPAPEVDLGAFERDLTGAPPDRTRPEPTPAAKSDAIARDHQAPSVLRGKPPPASLRLTSFEREAPPLAAPTPTAQKPPSTAAWNLASYERDRQAPPQPIEPPDKKHRLGSYLRAILAAASVFAAVAFTHALIGGFRFDLVVRAVAAALLTGISWQVFDAGRFRAALLGVGTQVLLFGTTARIGEVEQIIALGMGALVTLVGSTLLGMSREQDRGLALHR